MYETAQDPRTALKDLELLMRSEDVLDWTSGRVAFAALTNPNVPHDVAVQAIEDAAFPIGALERCVRLDDQVLAKVALERLLAWKDRPDESEEDGLFSEDWEVRVVSARVYSVQTRENLEQALENETDEDVQAALHAHPLILSAASSTTPRMLSLLAHDNDWEVRQGVACHPSTPTNVLQILSEDGDEDVQQAAVEALIQRDERSNVLLSIAENSETSSAILTVLATSTDDAIRTAVAEHVETPIAVLAELMRSEDVLDWTSGRVAFAALTNPNVPHDVAVQAIEDPAFPIRALERCVRLDDQVLAKVALERLLALENDPEIVLAELMRSEDVLEWTSGRLAFAVLTNPKVSHDVAVHAIEDPAFPIGALERCALLDDPVLAEIALEQLLAWEDRPDECEEDGLFSEDWEVRAVSARVYNLHTRETLEQALKNETDEDVQVALQAHPLLLSTAPSTAPGALGLLAHDNDWEVRQGVALHPLTPTNVLQDLLGDETKYVQRAAAETLVERGELSDVLLSIAEDSETSSAILTVLATSTGYETRTAVAEHSATPIAVLAELMRSEDVLDWTSGRVAFAALTNPNVPHDVAVQAIEDPAFPIGALERCVRLDDPLLAELALKRLLVWEDRPDESEEDGATSDDWEERVGYARSLASELDVLQIMLTDHDDDVASAAQAHPLLLAVQSQHPGILAFLAQNAGGLVRQTVATNLAVPYAVLLDLLQDAEEDVRRTTLQVIATHADAPEDALSVIASATTTASDILAGLAEVEEWEVRAAVAGNRNTPLNILIQLTCLKAPGAWADERVAWAAANNPSFHREALLRIVKEEQCSLGFLERLTRVQNDELSTVAVRKVLTWDDRQDLGVPQDELLETWRRSTDWSQRLAYARTYHLPSYANLLEMINQEEDEEVLAALLAHPLTLAHEPTTSAAVLSLLSRDEDWQVRLGVAFHPSTSAEVREWLKHDEHSEVRQSTFERGESDHLFPQAGSELDPKFNNRQTTKVKADSIKPLISEQAIDRSGTDVQLSIGSDMSGSAVDTSDIGPDRIQISLQEAVDGRALCAEVMIQSPSLKSIWPTCQSPDGTVAPLVYPMTSSGEVNVREGQTLLLMFDVQGRYQEPWTVHLAEHRDLTTVHWRALTERQSSTPPPPPELDIRLFHEGTWPALLPEPEADLVPVFRHVMHHQVIPLHDLHNWMDRQGLGRASRRAFSRYLDQLVDLGWPIIIRNEAYQPPRLEVDQRTLNRLKTSGTREN